VIQRLDIKQRIETSLGRSRIVELVGPRQSGKTTLAREFVPPTSRNYFDLEDPASLIAIEQPMTALRELRGLVVIDEAQRMPELFPVLRVLADRNPLPAKFLILGSAAPEMMRNASESLAGRKERIELGGFTLNEVGMGQLETHWLRGGLPLSFLAANDADSAAWRKNFVQDVIARDLPMLGVAAPAVTLLRFWTMLAHYHGQVWNAAEFARALGITEAVVRRYLDALTGTFMVRQLQPWFENLGKRQIKSPKIYLRDSGLLHQLLGVRTSDELLRHPRLGASWEGYVLEQVLQQMQPDEAYFWGTHAGAELDVLMMMQGRRVGIEIKRADAPKLTPSMRIALDDLRLDELIVIYPGEREYALAEQVRVVPLITYLHPI
jgi:predicted AAA+ superfamily ATPase